jgi:hypothetical protein
MRTGPPGWAGTFVTFSTWGGAPATICYDNASTLGRLVGGRFEPCEDFTSLRSAHRFRAHHCAGWAQTREKGLSR